MNILEELKLSKKQNNDKRYEYLCQQFNVVDYAIKLEKYTIKLQRENKTLKENAEHNDKVVDKVNWENMLLKKENKQLENKLSKIEILITNHNRDIGDIYYKYNNRFLKSELKQRILEIVYEESDA